MDFDGYAKKILEKSWGESEMKQTAVIKSLRFVQLPTTECMFAVSSVVNLPFRPIVPIAEQMDAQGERVALSMELDDVLGSEGQAHEAQGGDPLLALAGTLESEAAEAGSEASAVMRETETDQSQEAETANPLLTMAGTLECEVTDIGERHDDYIGDALLEELRGKDNE